MRTELRSTEELIELAKIEFGYDASMPIPATAALHARGTRDVLDAAIALCASPNSTWRAVGANILGQLGLPERTYPEECCDALVQLLHTKQDNEVLECAVFALAHLGNTRAHQQLTALRHHPSDTVRRGVAMGLNGTLSAGGIAALLELMTDLCAEVRDWATTGIGDTPAIDGSHIREALLQRARDTDVLTRAEALNGLARRCDPRGISLLLEELNSPREHADLFRDAAEQYLLHPSHLLGEKFRVELEMALKGEGRRI